MIFSPDLIDVGYLKKKSSSYEGLLVHHFLGQEIALPADEFLFVEIHRATRVPFRVKASQSIDTRTFRVRIDEQAYSLIFAPYTLPQKWIYMETPLVARYATNDAILMIKQFDVFTEDNIFIGKVVDELETPSTHHYRTLLLERAGKTHSLFYHPDLLIELNADKRFMRLRLPSSYIKDLEEKI